MDLRRADDRLGRHRQLDRMQDERPRLGPAQSAVERDQLLERAALLELGVVEAVDHDVGDVLEAVGAQQVRRRRWPGTGPSGSSPSTRPSSR